jgi:hypothetical protein
MLFLVALCATAATYGIRNATAIGTIAITHAFVKTMPYSAVHQLFTLSFYIYMIT